MSRLKPQARVVVLNQFAMPRGHWGLTRHADLFEKVATYSPLIIAGRMDHYRQDKLETEDPLFVLVSVPAYKGSAHRRIASWIIFALKAGFIASRQRRLAVVYASSPHLLTPLAGAAVAALRRVPLIVEVRDLWPESIVEAGMLRRGSLSHRMLTRLEQFVYRRADHIVVVTAGWTDHFKTLGVADSKVTVIANGVDVETMTVSETSERLRAEFGFPQDRTIAIYAGAHGPANGLDQLLEAADELSDLEVILIGAGTERDRLVELAESRGMSNVKFMDPVPKAELARILAACDIGIHVLAPWGLLQRGLSPNKLFDYMAAGLPVVSNCAPGLEKVIADGECGRLSQPADFAAALRAVAAASPDERHQWGTAGRAIIAQRFSRTAAAQQLTDLLASVEGRTL